MAFESSEREELRRRFAKFAQSRDPDLRNSLIEAHLGLAEYLARRFSNRGEPLDDLVQVASVGLLKAVDRFDPERGVEFSTYATHTVVGELTLSELSERILTALVDEHELSSGDGTMPRFRLLKRRSGD